MRTAIISDLHGWLPTVEAALADAAVRGCDRVVCLGDVVDGGPDDEAVVALLRRRDILTVKGNHDIGHARRLANDTTAWLARLPLEQIEGDTCFAHICPAAGRAWRLGLYGVIDAVQAWNVFDESAYRLTVVGHTHASRVFASATGRDGARRCEADVLPMRFGVPVDLDPARRHVIAVGSTAYSRDADRRPRYAILDDAGPAARRVTFVALNVPGLHDG